VAEEVKDVRRKLPVAIVLTLLITTGLYVVLAIICVLVVAPEELAASAAPLTLVYRSASGADSSGIGLVGVVAAVNGALIQIIMASRVLYCLASTGQLPAGLARVHPRTRTPLLATRLVGGCVLVLAASFPLVTLAEVTSLVMLGVFATVNIALLRIKSTHGIEPAVFNVQRWVPALGAIVSVALLVYDLASSI